MMIDTLQHWWRRAGQAAALVAMAVLGLFDVAAGGIFLSSTPLGLAFGLFQIAVAVAAAAVWLPAHRPGERWLPIVATGVALCSLAVTAQRSAGLTDGFGGWGLAESAGLLGIVFVLARWANPASALGVIALTGLAVTAMPLRVAGSPAYVIVGMAYALLAAGAAAAGMYLRLAANSRERQLATVRAEQRAEFARDLHDFIAHHVTGIVVQAQGARYVAEQDPHRAVTALEQIERAGLETMAAMRRMVGVLRGQDAAPDAPLAPLAGVAELPELLENFAAAGPPDAHLHTEGRLDDLPVDVTSSAYRVVMEALTNVRQHATGAQRVDVWLRRTPQWLLVRVTDDGRAPRPGRPGEPVGFGLAGLAERVAALGGRLHAGPGIGGGWIVDASLPVDRDGAR